MTLDTGQICRTTTDSSLLSQSEIACDIYDRCSMGLDSLGKKPSPASLSPMTFPQSLRTCLLCVHRLGTFPTQGTLLAQGPISSPWHSNWHSALSNLVTQVRRGWRRVWYCQQGHLSRAGWPAKGSEDINCLSLLLSPRLLWSCFTQKPGDESAFGPQISAMSLTWSNYNSGPTELDLEATYEIHSTLKASPASWTWVEAPLGCCLMAQWP